MRSGFKLYDVMGWWILFLVLLPATVASDTTFLDIIQEIVEKDLYIDHYFGYYIELGDEPAKKMHAGPGSDDEYHDILHRGRPEWRLVFRGTAGAGSSVYEAYTKGKGIPSDVEEACKHADWSASCKSHWRNDEALDKWEKDDVQDVLFGLVANGNLVKTLRFNGTRTNTMNWFSAETYLDSCYGDMESLDKNYFSIEGISDGKDVNRRFFINKEFGGCSNDDGWVVAIDGPERYCDWESKGEYPIFRYSAGVRHSNWNRKTAVKSADAMVIFVRYHPDPGPSEQYFDLFDTGMKEYRLAFRATANVGSPMLDAYLTGRGIPENVQSGCKSIDWEANCNSHYRNDAALHFWSDIDEILLAVVDKGTIVKTLTFDGKGTTYTSWFSRSKLKDPCGWEDMLTEPKNYFSMKGHDEGDDVKRHFFINSNYNDCSKDAGWLVSVDNPRNPKCKWENGDHIPKLMYSPGPRVTTWDQSNIGVADAFVIFLKYKK